ncbi:MAG: copper chaperone PCu(A)C [Corynebacterium sp.]|nr:copper chaperone PCu(A)C [Corynebacterium sp.]
MKKYTRFIIAPVAAFSLLALAACGSDDDSTDATTSTETTSSSSATSSAVAEHEDEAITFDNAYIRAMNPDATMTALFGELHNNTDADIVVSSLTSSIPAESYELHEVVDGVMQVKEGGFTIPAGGEVVLQPGSDHFMLMGVQEPVLAGDTASVTLTLDDGQSIEFSDIAVRTVGAGDEDYGDISHGEE